ncbi:MAG TPA: hypothetical protein VF120_08435, partial [Ktedonobacterales bacterium]
RLFWVLAILWFLYLRPWQRDIGAANDPSFLFAWQFIKVVFTGALLVFMAALVGALLDATVWATPAGARPATQGSWLDLAFDIGWIILLGVTVFWRRRRGQDARAD